VLRTTMSAILSPEHWAQSVVVHGVKVLPAGTPVSGTVVAAKGQGRFKGSGDLGIAIRRVGNYDSRLILMKRQAKARANGLRDSWVAAQAAGALIGGLAGGGKGALIGGCWEPVLEPRAPHLPATKDITVPAESVVTFKPCRADHRDQGKPLTTAFPAVAEVGLRCRSKLQILRNIIRVRGKLLRAAVVRNGCRGARPD